eukprot:Rhum_TRINITY_DN11700_c0_g3::Rhum_TRINITY_DN11700_c0_g3_i2::g.46323::m.46323
MTHHAVGEATRPAPDSPPESKRRRLSCDASAERDDDGGCRSAGQGRGVAQAATTQLIWRLGHTLNNADADCGGDGLPVPVTREVLGAACWNARRLFATGVQPLQLLREQVAAAAAAVSNTSTASDSGGEVDDESPEEKAESEAALLAAAFILLSSKVAAAGAACPAAALARAYFAATSACPHMVSDAAHARAAQQLLRAEQAAVRCLRWEVTGCSIEGALAALCRRSPCSRQQEALAAAYARRACEGGQPATNQQRQQALSTDAVAEALHALAGVTLAAVHGFGGGHADIPARSRAVLEALRLAPSP